MSDSVRPHRQQPTRLPCPWDSPGKNTGVGCHFLLQCMKVKSESEVTQSCPTLATPWTAAYQAPPSMGFSRQDYRSKVPLPSPKITLDDFKNLLTWSLGREDPLEKEMATHSSSLAWKIPWTEEPGRLQPMESQRIEYNWATSLSFSFLLTWVVASTSECLSTEFYLGIKSSRHMNMETLCVLFKWALSPLILFFKLLWNWQI